MACRSIKSLADLTPDPRNTRVHNERNVGMIEDALHEVGAARSIVIDEDGVILAGNATAEAAGNAGIGRVMVVDADGETLVAVRRKGLTDAQKARLGAWDNRTAELATGWDAEMMAALMEEGVNFDGMFTDKEIGKLLDQPTEDPESDGLGISTVPEQFMIMIECETEDIQASLLDELSGKGLKVRALVS